MGKVVIDATGDADVAFRAGAPTKQGRDFDGRVQSMGSFFHIDVVPELGEEQQAVAVEKVRQAMAIGQAAGTAASLSVCHEVWPRDVDADELRRVLQADGALVSRKQFILTSSSVGTVGQVGTVEVDAESGEMLASEGLREQILDYVRHLASPAPAPVG